MYMNCSLVFAALTATSSFCLASVIELRDENPTFDFALYVFTKIDEAKFPDDGSSSIVLTEQSPTSGNLTGWNIYSGTGGTGTTNRTSSAGFKGALVTTVVFHELTESDKPRQIWIDNDFNNEHTACNISVKKEPHVGQLSWFLNYGLEPFASDDIPTGSDTVEIKCREEQWE